jgi:hypothetical protein
VKLIGFLTGLETADKEEEEEEDEEEDEEVKEKSCVGYRWEM